MVIEGRVYQELYVIYNDIHIVINDKWKAYYTQGGAFIKDYFMPPYLINTILICLKHEFEDAEFTEENIKLFKERFKHLLQCESKIERQMLTNLTLIKLDNIIEGNLRKVRKKNV